MPKDGKKTEIFDDPQMEQAPLENRHPDATKWYWVLSSPITINRDALMTMESDGAAFVPIFLERAEAEAFLDRLGPASEAGWVSQAMHLFDIKVLAREKGFLILTLDREGKILETLVPEAQA